MAQGVSSLFFKQKIFPEYYSPKVLTVCSMKLRVLPALSPVIFTPITALGGGRHCPPSQTRKQAQRIDVHGSDLLTQEATDPGFKPTPNAWRTPWKNPSGDDGQGRGGLPIAYIRSSRAQPDRQGTLPRWTVDVVLSQQFLPRPVRCREAGPGVLRGPDRG